MNADLELRNVFYSYSGPPVLKDFSIVVPHGELCCLLGPSGCGKTTALKIILGLIQPDRGNVWLGGENITRVPCRRRNLGMVFQNYALFPHLDVYENVAYGLRRRRVGNSDTHRRVLEALEVVRLTGYERRRIHALSGGQQQRVALARALVIEPSLLLLDEPLSNLDARLRIDMRREILRIQRLLNITAIYVTHDQEEAIGLADRIVVINEGTVEQIGSPKEIYERPRTRFVADFIGRINFVGGRLMDGSLQFLGQRFAAAPGLRAKNANVDCAIRPERITVEKPKTAPIRGRVMEKTYLGSVVHYRVRVETESSVSDLSVDVSAPLAEFDTGDEIGIKIDPRDVVVYDGELNGAT